MVTEMAGRRFGRLVVLERVLPNSKHNTARRRRRARRARR